MPGSPIWNRHGEGARAAPPVLSTSCSEKPWGQAAGEVPPSSGRQQDLSLLGSREGKPCSLFLFDREASGAHSC